MSDEATGRTAEFFCGVDERLQRLLGAAGSEYEVGMDLMGYTMRHLEREQSAGSLYLMWGSLTDWIDGPRADEPGVRERAIAEMRRAASEWLETRHAGKTLNPYLDRWVYDECGYARRPADQM